MSLSTEHQSNIVGAVVRLLDAAANALNGYAKSKGVEIAAVAPAATAPAAAAAEKVKPTRGRASSDDKAPAAPAAAPAAAAPAGDTGNASGGEKMTTETARPRILAVAQHPSVGSQKVKDLIKKQTGCDALKDVPAEKLPDLVKAAEALVVEV
jgi:hypothetical protein